MEEIDVLAAVEQLKDAGSDPSRQVLPLLKLAEWHLRKSKATTNGADFTKANALYNAALVRLGLVKREVGEVPSEDEIVRGIIDTYRAFLLTFTNNEDVGVGEITDEINLHKQFLTNERRIFKERLDELDSCFIKPRDGINAEHQYEVLKSYKFNLEI